MPADPEVIERIAEAMEPAFRDMGFVGPPRERREAMARAALGVIEAERQKWIDLREADREAARMIAAEFAVYRERFARFMDQPESERERYKALAEAAREVWHWSNSAHSGYQPSPVQQMNEAAMWQRVGAALSAIKAIEEAAPSEADPDA